MKEINYSYQQRRDIVKKGIELTGMYSITKGKRILFTALCIFIITNSAYALISTGKFSLIHLFYIIFGVLILGYVWFLPNFLIKRKINSVDETQEVSLSVKPAEIVESKGTEKTVITSSSYRGYLKGENIFAVFGATNYLVLPTDGFAEEEIAQMEEILKYFHNPDYFKTEEEKLADSEPEFPEFVPPDDFIPEEEKPTNLENEDA